MVLFNYSTRELTAKIVYYGPGLCGKTTNLQFIYKTLPENIRKGKMLSLATKTDRTLFFDFLPIDLGRIRGLRTRIQLYTVPGQVFYNSTRKLVLKGADAVVFVADSQKRMIETNLESFQNLEENLKELGISLAEIPHVLQFNKRDLSDLATVEEMNSALNRFNAPFYESVATTGIGVEDTLRAVIKLVLGHLSEKYQLQKDTGRTRTSMPNLGETPAPPAAAEPPAPVATPEPPAPVAVQAEAGAGEATVDPEVEITLEPPAAPTLPDAPPAPAMTQAIPIMEEMGKGEPGEDVFDLDADMPDPVPAAARPAEPAVPEGPEIFSQLKEKEVDRVLEGLTDEGGGLGLTPPAAEAEPPAPPPPAEPPEEPAAAAPFPPVPPVAVQLALTNGGEVSIPLEVQLDGKTVRYRLKMSLQVLVDDPASRN